MMQICQHFLITGRVQGVSFRYYTRHKAVELGLTGWVRNLTDGRVEVTACGDASAMAQFQKWLTQGPTLARVSDIEAKTLPCQQFARFQILDTAPQ
ncbi:acylphosphatase [Candidatus Albibeggiatoa sp. nov. NOAA]|uniref:acylphosphatase n=1 Tax=Candidatus Albibeggiatoa sp. nov. NOAA TaxID=3162724 RepID=UPI0032F36C74|nr:acylphosphatase [Thiotrichaceae bacterium]